MVECELNLGNVNTEISAMVLIDTWWNVNNYLWTYPRGLTLSFNRYMVECE